MLDTATAELLAADRIWLRLRERWRANPISYFRHRLGIVPTHQQAQILRALTPDGAKVTVRAGHGVGKTVALAGAVFWMLECFDFSKVPCTAPTAHQLRDVLWSEMRKLARLSDLYSAANGLPERLWISSILDIHQDHVAVVGAAGEWFAVARTARKESPDALQGFHASSLRISADGKGAVEDKGSGRLMFIVDEAPGVPDEIFEAAEGALSSRGSRFVMAGNPLRRRGYFADSHNGAAKDSYTRLHFRSQDSPLGDPEFKTKLERKFGVGSNVVRVRCDGDFPLQDDDVLVAIADAEAALIRSPAYPETNEAKAAERRHLGIDVARFGDDRTTYVLRAGPRVEYIEVRAKQSLMETTGRAMVLWRQLRADEIDVDATGLGAGVCDRLREQQAPVVDVNVAEAAPVREGYGAVRGEAVPCRLRDYLWVECARWMRDCEPSFALADRDHAKDLAGELCCVTYTVDSAGRVIAEPKSSMKKRGLRSPDLADALCLTFMPPRRSMGAVMGFYRGNT